MMRVKRYKLPRYDDSLLVKIKALVADLIVDTEGDIIMTVTYDEARSVFFMQMPSWSGLGSNHPSSA